MSSWSQRRRLIYAVIVIVVLVAAVGVPIFLGLYRAPTCFDGIRNGDEGGVDCDGSCAKLCPSAFLPPAVSWVRFKEVGSGRYNVAAYVINPNQSVEAKEIPYKVTLYDREALPIAETIGTVTLPARRNSMAFKASVNTGIQTPIRGTFEFLAIPDWVKDAGRLDDLRVTDQTYIENPSDSSLLVTILNEGVEPEQSISVAAVLKDADGNVLNFSKTIVDSIPAGESRVAPFTWPISHDRRVVSMEVLLVAE